MRLRLVTNSVCVGDVPTGDHHRVVGDLGLYFWFLVIVRVKGVLFFYCRLYFLDRFFFNALFLYFGLLVG